MPLWRLHLLRLGYLVLGGGLAVYRWPDLFNHDRPWPLMSSVVTCMLVAMSILAFFGLRYPVQMLPVLLFEVAWKLTWLVAVALPLWLNQQMDPDTWASAMEILWVVVILAVVPWRYVFSNFLVRRGDRWR
ncbi:putative effector of murein hydrolase [Saccharothrix ecbatanensis]|uniref:Putative effector of murein hydrolase n=1 Tax=Saccharothrix ecbatanensis TaxID=1105145 RepID=A0A7W9M131_9PSEU|nr:putative effector of murein hydrolase [Saccharothrix ecbatanensis]